ncbi:hypothetical protein EON65_49580 [archaeon]|nr:MAG: hypothetical protein EON65_49580 [archaeon]
MRIIISLLSAHQSACCFNRVHLKNWSIFPKIVRQQFYFLLTPQGLVYFSLGNKEAFQITSLLDDSASYLFQVHQLKNRHAAIAPLAPRDGLERAL